MARLLRQKPASRCNLYKTSYLPSGVQLALVLKCSAGKGIEILRPWPPSVRSVRSVGALCPGYSTDVVGLYRDLSAELISCDWSVDVNPREGPAAYDLCVWDFHPETALASRSISRAKPASLALPAQPFGGAAVLEQVREANEKAERTAILTALSTTRWNRKQAAAVLKIEYKALLYKMKKLQIDGTAEEAGPPPPKTMAAGRDPVL
jgi:DNA-binding NtrC family response regulator